MTIMFTSGTATATFSLLLLSLLRNAQGQDGCSGPVVRFPAQESQDRRCLDSWDDSVGAFKAYPEDFEGVLNEVAIYQCPSRGVRVIVSNGVPDHDVTLQNNHPLCEIHWIVELPLDPVVADARTEIPLRGMIAMAANGIPTYGPMETADLNAVEPTDSAVTGAGFWYGHASNDATWHFHNPNMGEEIVNSRKLMGYAMDGFPIYGPLDDDEVDQLDACNGITNDDGSYQYHVRTFDQVDEYADYCNGDSPETNWNYILGCYSGSVESTAIYSADDYTLDDDCTLQVPKKGKPKNNQRRHLRQQA